MKLSTETRDRLFLQRLARAGLPRPEREYRFAPPRRWRFDFAWPAARLAVECEGGVWTRGRHTRGSGFLADMDKYNVAAVAGWCVLRYTPQQLVSTRAIRAITAALSVL